MRKLIVKDEKQETDVLATDDYLFFAFLCLSFFSFQYTKENRQQKFKKDATRKLQEVKKSERKETRWTDDGKR